MGRLWEESIAFHDCMKRERPGRYVGLTGMEFRMGDEMGDMWDLQGWYTEWEMNGRYVGLTGVVYRMGDEWEICGTCRGGIQNGR